MMTETDNARPPESLAPRAAAAAGAESTAAGSLLPSLTAGPLEPERTGSAGEPLVSAELADLLHDADTLDVLSVLRLAVSRGNPKVARYCAQLLQARFLEAAEVS